MSPERDADVLEQVPVQGMRGVIARRMTESLREMAQLTLHREVDVTQFVEFRESFAGDLRPSVNDLLLVAISRTLARHPEVNATLADDVISRWRTVHLGMAVAVDAGLIVPVIRNAHALSLEGFRDEAARLGRLAREGGLTLADLQGGTCTVSNLGAFGIDSFTPIVNPPQVAIVGVGRIHGGLMTLSLTIDHRALDGAPGALFLADMTEALERPEGLL